MKRLLYIFSFFLIFTASCARAQSTGGAELLAQRENIMPGQTFYLALKLTLPRASHVYWKNPGDEKRTNIPGILTNEEFKNTVSYNTEWWRSNAYNSSVGRKDVADHIWQMYDYSDIRVVSGDYLKVSTVSIRYNVPDDFCKKIGMKSAYIGFTGTNLYTFCSKKLKGQDPIQSGSTSTITQSVRPTYSLTLNITL